MNGFSYDYMVRYIEEHSRELQQEAANERLARSLLAGQPTAWNRLSWRLGGWLVGLGQRLQQRQPASQSGC